MTIQIPVGLEDECFSKYRDTDRPVDVLGEAESVNKLMNGYGKVTSDAGLGHLEFVTPPRFNLKTALNDLQRMLDMIPSSWELFFTARCPDNFPGRGEWADKSRYVAMFSALSKECPDTWHGVKAMSEWAAIHLNMGIDPWSPQGLLVMNTINNVGPYIAAQLRDHLPQSRGHLAIWSGWAHPKRLPLYDEWFTSRSEFSCYFSSIPSLIKGQGKDDDTWESDLVNPQSIDNQADLGTWWKLARPKLGPGGWYIEIRLLPAMQLPDASYFLEELVLGISAILSWSYENEGPVVQVKDDADAAIKYAAQASDLFPSVHLSEDQWGTCLAA